MPNVSKKNPKYQSRAIAYPKHAFMVFIGMKIGDNKLLYPFEFIYTSYDEMTFEAKAFRKHFSDATSKVENECLVLPMTLESVVPLLPEYWKQTAYLPYYHSYERHRLFLNFLSAPHFHLVLVTPYGRNNGREYLSAAIPISRHNSENQIKNFMFGSDYPVDQEAQKAATYRPETPFFIDWARKIVLPGGTFKVAKVIN
jgi:hypothetical protein